VSRAARPRAVLSALAGDLTCGAEFLLMALEVAQQSAHATGELQQAAVARKLSLQSQGDPRSALAEEQRVATVKRLAEAVQGDGGRSILA